MTRVFESCSNDSFPKSNASSGLVVPSMRKNYSQLKAM